MDGVNDVVALECFLQGLSGHPGSVAVIHRGIGLWAVLRDVGVDLVGLDPDEGAGFGAPEMACLGSAHGVLWRRGLRVGDVPVGRQKFRQIFGSLKFPLHECGPRIVRTKGRIKHLKQEFVIRFPASLFGGHGQGSKWGLRVGLEGTMLGLLPLPPWDATV